MNGTTFVYLKERAAQYRPVRRRSQMNKISYLKSRELACQNGYS